MLSMNIPKGDIFEKITKSENDVNTTRSTVTMPDQLPFRKRIFGKILNKLKNISFFYQMLFTIAFYYLHITFLSKRSINFRYQLWPNSLNMFCSIGYDNLLALVLMMSFFHIRKNHYTLLEPVFSDNQFINSRTYINKSKKESVRYPWYIFKSKPQRRKMVTVVIFLIFTYFLSGYTAALIEWILCLFSAFDLPISVPINRALQVLGGHFAWVAAGLYILQNFSPKNDEFCFIKKTDEREFQSPDIEANHANVNSTVLYRNTQNCTRKKTSFLPFNDSTWFRLRARQNWLFWVGGGYLVSGLLFQIADFSTHVIIPELVQLAKNLVRKQKAPNDILQSLEPLEDQSVVNKMLNPEDGDMMALALGAIAPCLSAPLWEELIYRGYLLPVLAHYFNVETVAVPLSALLFAAHHMTLSGFLSLATLGWLWSWLYIWSNNLFVSVMIHGLWNTRVFLSSFLGI